MELYSVTLGHRVLARNVDKFTAVEFAAKRSKMSASQHAVCVRDSSGHVYAISDDGKVQTMAGDIVFAV